MFKKRLLIIVVLVAVINFAHAQDADMAQLRIMQLSFVPDVSATVTIELDKQPLFENISFPFTTDYATIPAGDHQLTLTVVDADDISASTELILESGHTYSVIAEGDYSADAVQFVLIDEGNVSLDTTGSAAIVVNLTPVEFDIYIEDELALDDLSTGAISYLSLPLIEFTAYGTFDGDSSERVEIDTFSAMPNTVVLAVARYTDSGELQTIFHRSSDLTIADYVRATVPATVFHVSASALSLLDELELLNDDGRYTVFLPHNDTFEVFDLESLPDVMSNHIVPENLPPTILPQHETLTTINGDTVTLQFGDTESGYWEIEGAPILWDVRLRNGTLYVIDGVILSSD